MKKILSLLLALCGSALLSGCALLEENYWTSEESSSSESSVSSQEDSSELEDSFVQEDSSERESDSESVEEEVSSTPDSSEKEETPPAFRYTAFTADDEDLFLLYFDLVIPFAPTNEYYVEEEYDYDYGDVIINYWTVGNTKAEFDAYRQQFSSYTFVESYEDDYGDTCYLYQKGNVVVDMCYYYDEYDKTSYIDVYVYWDYSEDDNTGGSDNEGGNTGGGSTTVDGVLTNQGAGLPKGTNGVYTVDFTKGKYVENVTDQGYYLDGCPTLGSPAVLVIPVEFSDATASSKGYSVNNIKKVFNGSAGDTDYYSVHDYYYTSSYGQLDLDITVLDSWFRPKYSSSYYKTQTMDYYGTETEIGDQMILDEALTSLAKTMDLSKFDSDGNDVIDAVVLISTLDVDSEAESNLHWAYRYWNIYADDDGYYFEYDGVTANDYLWAPYQFMHEGYDRNGNPSYSDTSVMNTYTYIHEFGHVLGADDYYDTSYTNHPLEGLDVMDSMNGDHNPYTKFNFGWLTSSRLVVADGSITLTLEDFSKNGDTIIIANNWDEELGVYQEYYVLIYYKGTGLNGGDNGYFSRDGIVVYHVNASLYVDEESGTPYYDVYNNNTDPSDEYGTEDNLIELVKSTKDTYTYGAGDTISKTTKDDQGNTLSYVFTVDSLTDATATITFTKNK